MLTATASGEASLSARRQRFRKSAPPAVQAEQDSLRLELPHPTDLAAAARVIATAESPPNTMDEFAEEAANRLEQDLLMLSNGIRKRAVATRLRQYQGLLGEPCCF